MIRPQSCRLPSARSLWLTARNSWLILPPRLLTPPLSLRWEIFGRKEKLSRLLHHAGDSSRCSKHQGWVGPSGTQPQWSQAAYTFGTLSGVPRPCRGFNFLFKKKIIVILWPLVKCMLASFLESLVPVFTLNYFTLPKIIWRLSFLFLFRLRAVQTHQPTCWWQWLVWDGLLW